MKALLLLCVLGSFQAFATDPINVVVQVDKRAKVIEEDKAANEKELSLLSEKLNSEADKLEGQALLDKKKKIIAELLQKDLELKSSLCLSYVETCLTDAEINQLKHNAEVDKCKVGKEDIADANDVCEKSIKAALDSKVSPNFQVERKKTAVTPEPEGPKVTLRKPDAEELKANLPVTPVQPVVVEPKASVPVSPKKQPVIENPKPSPKSVAPLKEEVKPVVPKAKEIASEDDNQENDPRNYKPETCKWVEDLPRKIVYGPGCTTKGKSSICTGYVVCDQKSGEGQFIRMSSCSADKCGASDEDAVRCTKDQGYYSRKPLSEDKHFMSIKLKKVLTGTSEQ